MEKINSKDVQEIIHSVKSDPNQDNVIDTWINEIKESSSELPHYLEKKTFNILTKEIRTVLNRNKIPKEFMEKLDGYRYIDEINELFRGKFIRWIRIHPSTQTPKLTNGGIVMDIKFLDNGIQVLCRNAMNRFIQFKYDECLTFQKLTDEEWLLLSVKSRI